MWVAVLLLDAAILCAANTPADVIAVTTVAPGVRAQLTREYEIEVLAEPHKGDAWSRLSLRLTGDANRWEELAKVNRAGPQLDAGKKVRVPFGMLRADFQRSIISTIFPADRRTAQGWRHVVSGGRGIEGESLWRIAEWFTGDGANYTRIRDANPRQRLSTRQGDVIIIPRDLLTAAFAGGTEEKNASKAATEVRKADDDPVERTTADQDPAEPALEAGAVGLPSLTYERNVPEPYAVYRLQRGEALYSSVAIRFTGRVYARDVHEVLERIVAFNGIDDVSKIHVGHPVKIPLELLLPEYRPFDDPTRLEREATKRESARRARRTRARDLTGVHIILDPGHGGRDAGTTHDGIWESTYVYDVMCRLKRVLEARTGATVWVTTKSASRGFKVADRDIVDNRSDHVVLTNPQYALHDPVVGVNLRWYLTNSIFRRVLASGVPRQKVVFLSIHADSLHPSLRGAMAYVPSERFVQGSYQKKGSIYLARAEVRERPVVDQSEADALLAEGLSRDLAESIIGSFVESGLKVHPFHPVRDNVWRGGREWLPAIIRYNTVPTRLLLEVCNLGNAQDRALMTTTAYRQKLAEVVYSGLLKFFGEQKRTVEPAKAVATVEAPR